MIKNHCSHSDFKLVIEAPLQELIDLQHSKHLTKGQALYCKVLVAFLSSDHSSLQSLCRDLENLANQTQTLELVVLFHLAKIRLSIRQRTVDLEMLRNLIGLMYMPVREPLQSEGYFVIARGQEVLAQHANAARFYDKSHIGFQKCGAHRKSMKALFNSLANQTRIDPSLSYISDYKKLCYLARRVKDNGTMAVALMNISREFESLADFNLSLKYATRAITFLQNDMGTLQYFMSLVHRAHLYLSLNQLSEAQRDLDRARRSEHIEIQAAVKYLTLQISGSLENTLTPADFKNMTKCWQERVIDNHYNKERGNDVLSKNEKRVRDVLSHGPHPRNALTDILRGSAKEPEFLLLRLKALFHRLRTQCKELVAFENGTFKLSNKS